MRGQKERQALQDAIEAGTDLTAREFPMRSQDFSQIAAMILEDAGIALQESKAALVYARLTRRLRTLGLKSFAEYCRLVAEPEGAEERDEMVTALTTNLTYFFRESHHFDILKAQVLPPLLRRAAQGQRIRLWSAGCSTGMEPYSLAMTLLEADRNVGSYDVKILATDIDRKVLAEGQAGFYPDRVLDAVPAALLERYFTPESVGGAQGHSVKEAARKLITFRPLNLKNPLPVKGPFDVIFCRNTVIYFGDALQRDIWQRFAGVLPEGAWLFVGHSERVTGPALSAFRPAGVTAYQRV
ncbi:protein-glutamate O-methyltransferase [Parvularcula oceani]|uniref:CheR family methyltransferase n=1 Tax=Parvularcula oceani TaxID=1247963 RepID=UPI0004E21D04